MKYLSKNLGKMKNKNYKIKLISKKKSLKNKQKNKRTRVLYIAILMKNKQSQIRYSSYKLNNQKKMIKTSLIQVLKFWKIKDRKRKIIKNE